ncbi:hypothetical protein RIF29_40802 [Crotalaria pallida]|uniref:Uncharacterized protein n=1 Tax=Crotalaria pallida TaxID=3830 RepID=A0AAN9E6T4_CROPI
MVLTAHNIGTQFCTDCRIILSILSNWTNVRRFSGSVLKSIQSRSSVKCFYMVLMKNLFSDVEKSLGVTSTSKHLD